MKPRYYFKNNLKNMSKAEAREYLNSQVFKDKRFNMHVKEVSHNLKIDEKIVKDVLVHYITEIMYVMNSVRKFKTRINIYCFFNFLIEKGKRV